MCERPNQNLVHTLYDFESKLPTNLQKEVGLKFDQDKPDFSLLPMSTLTGIVKVLGFGAKKYGRGNWKLLKNGKDRYSAAMMRHFTAWQSGESIDEESGLSHLYHMGCCLLFLIWGEENAS